MLPTDSCRQASRGRARPCFAATRNSPLRFCFTPRTEANDHRAHFIMDMDIGLPPGQRPVTGGALPQARRRRLVRAMSGDQL